VEVADGVGVAEDSVTGATSGEAGEAEGSDTTD
jgi:hypothetical protein